MPKDNRRYHFTKRVYNKKKPKTNKSNNNDNDDDSKKLEDDLYSDAEWLREGSSERISEGDSGLEDEESEFEESELETSKDSPSKKKMYTENLKKLKEAYLKDPTNIDPTELLKNSRIYGGTRNTEPKPKIKISSKENRKSGSPEPDDKNSQSKQSGPKRLLPKKRKEEFLPLFLPDTNLVQRYQWDSEAKEPNKKEKIRTDILMFNFPANHIRYRVTFTDECWDKEKCLSIMEKLKKKDQDKGLSDLKYNFYVGGDENIYEGKGWLKPPKEDEENVNMRHRRLDIAFIGKFKVTRPPPEMVNLAYNFVNFGIQVKKIARRFKCTQLD